MTKDWIVVTGTLVDSTKGGGLEFLGPYTEEDAKLVYEKFTERDMRKPPENIGFDICFAIQLIRANLPERWKNETKL